MTTEEIRSVVRKALEDLKAEDVAELDVTDKTSVTDYIIVASGTSNRHVRAVANNVVIESKKAGFRPIGVEGETDGEWVLVDLNDIVVHLMLPKTRAFYNLEKLWDASSARRSGAASPA